MALNWSRTRGDLLLAGGSNSRALEHPGSTVAVSCRYLCKYFPTHYFAILVSLEIGNLSFSSLFMYSQQSLGCCLKVKFLTPFSCCWRRGAIFNESRRCFPISPVEL